MIATLQNAKRIVLKLGSSLISEGAAVRGAWMQALAEDVAALHAAGKEVILVSSGAVALGRPRVGLGNQHASLEEKQAAAAAGQPLLMQAWQNAFAPHQIQVAQILLTLEDSERRRRYLNARTTLTTLLQHRLIPVVNENDTVATAELKFGDNDRLAARVAAMTGADVLVLFSDVDGLYTANPRTTPAAEHLARVDEITPEILAMAGGAASAVSNGGMRTKVEAAQLAVGAGCHMAIAKGLESHALRSLMEGGKATWFMAASKPQQARKQWISSTVQLQGYIVVDAGAERALRQGKSMLAAGVTGVEGTFKRGELVGIKTQEGKLIAKGMIAYDAVETEAIRGKKTDAIEAILGYAHRDSLIHRDDLAML